MIIEINIDRPCLEKERPDKNFIPELFSEIARVTGEGFHRIIINPDIIECFNNTNDLNTREIKQIEKQCQKFFELSSLVAEGIPFLRVNFGDDDLSRCNGFWQIGHIRLLEGNYLEKTILLVESHVDSEFYNFLLKAEAERIGFGHIDYYPDEGIGGTTQLTFRKHIDQRKILLCICDTDRLVPNGKVGETCRQLMKQNSELEDSFMGLLTCTPGHEMENLLPIDIVNSVSQDKGKKYTGNLQILIKDQGIVEAGDCLWLYYDIKDGVDWKRLKKIRESGTKDQKSWVKEKYDDHIGKIGCKELPKYGEVIGNFLKDESEKEKFKAHMREEGGYWELHYSNWVHSLLWYVCGEEPMIKFQEN